MKLDNLPREEFERWLNLPATQEVLAQLEHLRLTLIDRAEAKSMEQSYGFTNQAYGVKLALEQLKNFAVEPYLPENEQTT